VLYLYRYWDWSLKEEEESVDIVRNALHCVCPLTPKSIEGDNVQTPINGKNL